MAKACSTFKTGGKNFYEIVTFFGACLQVNGFVRPEKSTLLQTPHPFPCSKKDISLYKDNTGLVQQPDKIVARSSHNLTCYAKNLLRVKFLINFFR